jgi:hypothetical protein
MSNSNSHTNSDTSKEALDIRKEAAKLRKLYDANDATMKSLSKIDYRCWAKAFSVNGTTRVTNYCPELSILHTENIIIDARLNKILARLSVLDPAF